MSENETSEVSVENSIEQTDEMTDNKIANLVTEINNLKNNIGKNIIEIGAKLNEVRALFRTIKKGNKGTWGEWLKNNVDFTHQTANKFMECAKRFQNYAPARNFNSSQMFELLALPSAEEAIRFIDTKNHEHNPIENMKKLELRDQIKKWKSNAPTTDTSPVDSSKVVNAKDLKKLKRLFKTGIALHDSDNLDDLIQIYAEQNHDTIQEDLKILQKIVETFSKNVSQKKD